jgi:hypothetical protein
MNDTKCPYCQAEKYDNLIPQTDMAGNSFSVEEFFLCGSSLNFRPELCREREAHNKTKRERDELREKYDTLAVENMLEVNEICNQRDAAIDAIMKIEEIFIDGDDTYEDWKSMGQIARKFLEKNA